jgi:hypothetical protein
MVERSSRHPKVEGSCPAAATGAGREREGEVEKEKEKEIERERGRQKHQFESSKCIPSFVIPWQKDR